jgi:hypothetical protein
MECLPWIVRMLFLVPVLVALVVFSIMLDRRREDFENRPLKQTLTTHLDNMSGVLPPYAEEVSMDFMKSMVGVLGQDGPIPDNWQGTTLCIDPVDLMKVQAKNRGTTKRVDRAGYFVRLVHRDRRDELRIPQDIPNRRIGFFDTCEMHLIQAIAYGYRLPLDEQVFQMSVVPKNMRTRLEQLLRSTYDVIFAYIVPGSAFEKTVYSQEVYIAGFPGLDVSRINMTFPYVTMKKSYMSDVHDWRGKEAPRALYDKDGVVDLLWSYQHLFVIGNPVKETFITSLTVSKEMSDPAYRCYGELSNENRALCNSSYDAWGNPKDVQTYWDIPCTSNEECPFYKANKNYPNSRGGCQPNGVCEFPVGVRRIAYVKYRDDFPFTPMCYGCPMGTTDCCRNQKENPEKYPRLASPDYAFQNDIADRGPRGLDVIVPLQ